jgi:chemotaxis methyl-accepting protein methylase
MSTGFHYGESNRGSRLTVKFLLEHELTELRLLLERQAGVLLNAPQEILCERLTEYLKDRRIASVADLLGRLQNSDSESERLLDRLLDGETGFFRHSLAFETFEKDILPELHFRKSLAGSQSLRILSGGCSTGEEAYSIALSLCRSMNLNGSAWTIHILASDVRQSALTFAERGLYPQEAVHSIPAQLVQEHFVRVDQHVLAKPRLRNLITFTQMNLARPAYLGRFDCIFCMDVLPHFSIAQRMALAQRLHLYLEPGGYLLLGDGEKLPNLEISFPSESRKGCTFYRKPLAAAARAGKLQ